MREVHPVFLGSALPAFPVAACYYSFGCLHGRILVICGQEPGAFVPACAVSADQGKEREGNEDRGRSRHKEECIQKSQRWEAVPSENFGLF